MGRIARALATGYGYADPFTGYTGPTAWCPPLYPLLIAAAFKLAGVYTPASAWLLLTFNSLVSAATVPLIYEIAARCYNRRVALWSAWLWALYPAAMQYAVRWVWEMSLSTFIFTAILVIALRLSNIGDLTPHQRSKPTALWALFGLLWGSIALTNSTPLLFLPVCGVWILTGTRPLLPALARAALAAALFLACLTPWTLRNQHTLHAFIPFRDNFGAELRESLREEYLGFPWGTTVPLVDRDPAFLRYRQLGEVAYIREQSLAANRYLATHKLRFAQFTLKRVYFFWVSVPHPFEYSALSEYLREINFCFVSLAGLGGLALSLRRRAPAARLFAAALLLLPIPYYLLTVQARFRHPIEPLLTILGVYLFQSATRRPRAIPLVSA